MKQLKTAIFFDFGGTLMDYESDRKAHVEMMRAFRERCAVTESVEELTARLNESIRLLTHHPPASQMMLGRDVIRRSFEEVMGSLGRRPNEDDVLWFRQVYLEKHREYLRLYPEAHDVLRALSGTGLHIGLISDIDQDFMIDMLTRLGIIDLFDSVTCSEEAGVWKPNPRIFELAFSKAGCAGPEAIYVGDNLDRDIRGAKHMGMTTIWFPNSSYTSSHEPDYTIDTLKDIIRIVSDFGVLSPHTES